MAFLRLRRNSSQVSSMDEANHGLHQNLDVFHSNVAEALLPLFLPSPGGDGAHREPLLSLPVLRKLLDVLRLSLEDFHCFLLPFLPPQSPHLPDLSHRLVRSLDILNSASLSLHSLRSSLALARIASSSALSHPRRSRNALTRLLPSISPSPSSPRAWSFGRNSRHGEDHSGSPWRFPSLRGGEDSAAYAMSSLIVLVMSCLVAAFETGDAVARIPAVPRHLPWAAAANRFRERLRRGGASGLLWELQRMEQCARAMEEEEDEEVVRVRAKKLAEVCREMEELGPLEKQVREVFHTMAKKRVELMGMLRGSTAPASAAE